MRKIFITCRERLRPKGEWWRIWWNKRVKVIRKLKERIFYRCRNKKGWLIICLHNKNSHNNKNRQRELTFHVRHNNNSNNINILCIINTLIHIQKKTSNANHPYTQHSTTTTTTITTATNDKYCRYFMALPTSLICHPSPWATVYNTAQLNVISNSRWARIISWR